MKLLNYLVVLLWFSVSGVYGQHSAITNSLFWEIRKDTVSKPSYLFGTYHLAGKDFVDTMKLVNQRLEEVDLIVGELVIDDQLMYKLAPYMILKGTSMEELLNEEEYRLVDDYLRKVSGFNLKLLNNMNPAAIQATLLQVIAPKTISKQNPPLDQHFQSFAQRQGKPVEGLETVEEQALLLFGADLQRQKELLLDMARKDEENREEARALYEYYIQQDLQKLEELFRKPGAHTAQEMDQLLRVRNEKWLSKLPSLFERGSLFIAVGAGHLIGTDGLIEGLRKLGYTVTPIHSP